MHEKFIVWEAKRVVWLATMVGLLFASARSGHAAPAQCLSEPTLEDLIQCIKGYMPGEYSEAYQAPSSDDLNDWRSVIELMWTGQCGAALVPAGMEQNYTLTEFTDSKSGIEYCVFVETGDADSDGVVDLGWGTVIVHNDPGAAALSIDVPHPLNESRTPEQGIAIFQGTNARTFVMAGAHRRASATQSTCQSSYTITDGVHNADHTFYASFEALSDCYDNFGIPFTSIQLHGMSASSCPGVDAHITHGSTRTPLEYELIDQLRDNFTAAIPQVWNWTITVPGDSPTCSLTGSSNVQGRLLNGMVSDMVCESKPGNYTGNFIYIEQKWDVRSSDVYSYWIDAINNLDFINYTPSPGYWMTTPNGGETMQTGMTYTISWISQNIDDTVNLALYKNGTFHSTIISSTADTGSYTWTVPGNVPLGDDITIRIKSTVDGTNRDYSDGEFTLAVGTIGTWGWDACSPATPCEAGAGDCDSSADCAAGLSCVTDAGVNYGWDPDVDVCEDTCHTNLNGNWTYCSPGCPCNDGEGDCDSDDDCVAGTECVNDVGALYGFPATMDMCQAI